MLSQSEQTDSIFSADTIMFSDSPTLIATEDKSGALSEFKLPVSLEVTEQTLYTPNESELAPETETSTSNENPIQAPRNRLYTISHEIGVGGYGLVWQGIQNNLARKVAIKTLKQEHIDQAQQVKFNRIFRQEALTTAYIQHPNVVPVYDLSYDDHGRPLVAMKLVEGRQWNKVLSDDFNNLNSLEFLEKHLQVLISVAQAVAFAHSKGIIHRDLKPSQVMIGHFGEVLLMDWGLAIATRGTNNEILCDPAIVVDENSPLMYPIMPAGTPGYMAPEQTERDATRLGPWTDIYLLGAVLYELLTGYKPHPLTNNGDPLYGPRQNRISKPEVCNPERDIPAQLSRLAMKTLSTKPSSRIASASIFVNEIRDYLSRAGRRGESMALVTEVSKNIISYEHTYANLQLFLDKLDRAMAQWPDNHMASYLRKQVLATFARTALDLHDLKLARFQAERLKGNHESLTLLHEIELEEEKSRNQNEKLERAHVQARNERERAEALVRFLIIDLQDELRSTGRSDIVFKVANEAKEFFDALEGEEISQETLYNRCLVYLQVANVHMEYGRRAEAEAALSKAIEIVDSLLNEMPVNSEWKKLKADCLDKMGLVYYTIGQLDRAREMATASLTIRKESRVNAPLPYARTLQELARISWREMNFTEATEHIAEAISIVRSYMVAAPQDAQLQAELAAILFIQSNIFRDQGNLSSATKATYESLSLRIALLEQFPAVISRAEDVYWIRSNLGYLQMLAGDYESAFENLRHDLSARRHLYEEDVSNVIRNMGIVFQLSSLAEVTFLLDRLEDSERFLSECLLLSKKLVMLDANNPSALSSRAFHLVQWGELLATKGEWEECVRVGKKAVERARYAYWLSPSNDAILRHLVRALAFAARIVRKNNLPEMADSYVKEAEPLFDSITSKQSSGEMLGLKARLQLDIADPFDKTLLLKRAKEKRRFDPYLQAWAKEYNLTV